MSSADSRFRLQRLFRSERPRPRWMVPVLAVLPTLVLMTPLAVSAGMARAATPAAPVRASSVAKGVHFVGTLTVTEHLVWDFSSSSVAEHGQRNITGHVKLDLVVLGSRVVSFKATAVTVNGSMHLIEQIHPSRCEITTTHKLDTTGGSWPAARWANLPSVGRWWTTRSTSGPVRASPRAPTTSMFAGAREGQVDLSLVTARRTIRARTGLPSTTPPTSRLSGPRASAP